MSMGLDLLLVVVGAAILIGGGELLVRGAAALARALGVSAMIVGLTVVASFACLGDVAIAEPKAMIGFAGPRVIWNTVKTELPDGFQTAEFMLEHGFVDRIVPRANLRSEIARIIDYCGK